MGFLVVDIFLQFYFLFFFFVFNLWLFWCNFWRDVEILMEIYLKASWIFVVRFFDRNELLKIINEDTDYMWYVLRVCFNALNRFPGINLKYRRVVFALSLFCHSVFNFNILVKVEL